MPDYEDTTTADAVAILESTNSQELTFYHSESERQFYFIYLLPFFSETFSPPSPSQHFAWTQKFEQEML